MLLQCSTQSFFGMPVYIATVYLSGTEEPSPWLRDLSVKPLYSKYLDCLKMHFPAWSKVFFQTLLKKLWPQFLGAHTNTVLGNQN